MLKKILEKPDLTISYEVFPDGALIKINEDYINPHLALIIASGLLRAVREVTPQQAFGAMIAEVFGTMPEAPLNQKKGVR